MQSVPWLGVTKLQPNLITYNFKNNLVELNDIQSYVLENYAMW